MKIDVTQVLVGVAILSAVGLFATTRIGAAQAAAPIPATVAELIGPHPEFEGDPNSPATLVVFMDYQCAPCRRAHKNFEELLRYKPGHVRIVYRNLPESTLHKFAAKAALAALAAREQGKYWQMHSGLLATDLDSKTVDELVAKIGLDKDKFQHDLETTAQAELKVDEALARKCGFENTPSMVLCIPKAAPKRIANPEDIFTAVP